MDQIVWEYTAPDTTSFYASWISGAQRLPNGNTLICDGPAGHIFEVDQANEIVWDYCNPYYEQNLVIGGDYFQVFRANKYSPDYPGIQVINSVTAIDSEDIIPAEYSLGQNYPNPFNPETTISFTVPKAGPAALKVYNILGQEAAILHNGFIEAGRHSVSWHAGSMPSGIYFYTLTAADIILTKRMLLIK